MCRSRQLRSRQLRKDRAGGQSAMQLFDGGLYRGNDTAGLARSAGSDKRTWQEDVTYSNETLSIHRLGRLAACWICTVAVPMPISTLAASMRALPSAETRRRIVVGKRRRDSRQSPRRSAIGRRTETEALVPEPSPSAATSHSSASSACSSSSRRDGRLFSGMPLLVAWSIRY